MNRATTSYRSALPQLGGDMFLTDGGMETTLVYQEDWELPEFAAFVLLDSASGMTALTSYYERYIELALRYGTGLVLESPTWRASPRWGKQIGYSDAELADVNRRAIEQLVQLRGQHATTASPMVISGCLGPQDDGYAPATQLSVVEALEYHSFQANVFSQTAADMLCAVTFTYVEEAIGATLAAREVDMPIAISFTVETDGRLPSGCSLAEAIGAVDSATKGRPAYYMINCAHPTHFLHELGQQRVWTRRIGGVRANASRKSHAELDSSTELDCGDPQDFGKQYIELQRLLPNLRVLGGCCGTDQRHIEAVAQQCLHASESAAKAVAVPW